LGKKLVILMRMERLRRAKLLRSVKRTVHLFWNYLMTIKFTLESLKQLENPEKCLMLMLENQMMVLLETLMKQAQTMMSLAMLMNHYIDRLQQEPLKKPVSHRSKKDTTVNDFKKMLHHASKGNVKVSKHAGERLTERNIQINDATWQLIENKMQAAKQKGISDALVITDEAALVVSTK